MVVWRWSVVAGYVVCGGVVGSGGRSSVVVWRWSVVAGEEQVVGSPRSLPQVAWVGRAGVLQADGTVTVHGRIPTQWSMPSELRSWAQHS